VIRGQLVESTLSPVGVHARVAGLSVQNRLSRCRLPIAEALRAHTVTSDDTFPHGLWKHCGKGTADTHVHRVIIANSPVCTEVVRPLRIGGSAQCATSRRPVSSPFVERAFINAAHEL